MTMAVRVVCRQKVRGREGMNQIIGSLAAYIAFDLRNDGNLTYLLLLTDHTSRKHSHLMLETYYARPKEASEGMRRPCDTFSPPFIKPHVTSHAPSTRDHVLASFSASPYICSHLLFFCSYSPLDPHPSLTSAVSSADDVIRLL